VIRKATGSHKEEAMMEQGSGITESTVVEVARLGGLPLTAERIKALLPQLQTLRGELARLRELDFGETEPANIFVAGGEE
jgi:hypothetical protein